MTKREAELVAALADMVNQFAYDDGNPKSSGKLHSGGLSALEGAFAALRLPDPCTRSQLWLVSDRADAVCDAPVMGEGR